MTLKTKQIIIGLLGFLFLASLVFVQMIEVIRREEEAGLRRVAISVPAESQRCVDCHEQSNAGIIAHWKGSTHAEKGVGCYECHRSNEGDADGFHHEGYQIATIVTPMDCARCHPVEAEQFESSHHAAAGNILASLDNRLAEVAEGARENFNPHSPTPGRPDMQIVFGGAAAFMGCKQCHGSQVALQGTDGLSITFEELQPDDTGKPTNLDAVSRIVTRDGKPLFDPTTWPNTGIGRLNLDGSRGSCSACHSRHDFSPRRARQPENCGKCHLGPDHPQKEIYEESKHGAAFRDLKDTMNLDSTNWVLGEDYSQAPTCATCHMSGNSKNGGVVTHDPRERISWTNRPPISQVMDTDINGQTITETDPQVRATLVHDSWQNKRDRMSQVCTHCHTQDYVSGFYTQYDNLVVLYNEKFAKPGQAIIGALREQGLLTQPEFDEEIEWTWFYLWHHEGRRARHGASMMAPDYTQWHGMYEVAERFYMELIPQAREITGHAAEAGQTAAAAAVEAVIDGILARPEHTWVNGR